MYVFFFFKQKTAYELRISDWSSDVCSSDLQGDVPVEHVRLRKAQVHRFGIAGIIDAGAQFLALAAEIAFGDRQIDDELFKARETRRHLQLASGLFLDIDFQPPAIGGGAGLLLYLQIFLEIAASIVREIGGACCGERGGE